MEACRKERKRGMLLKAAPTERGSRHPPAGEMPPGNHESLIVPGRFPWTRRATQEKPPPRHIAETMRIAPSVTGVVSLCASQSPTRIPPHSSKHKKTGHHYFIYQATSHTSAIMSEGVPCGLIGSFLPHTELSRSEICITGAVLEGLDQSVTARACQARNRDAGSLLLPMRDCGVGFGGVG